MNRSQEPAAVNLAAAIETVSHAMLNTYEHTEEQEGDFVAMGTIVRVPYDALRQVVAAADIQAALSAPVTRKVEAWQPIETAPEPGVARLLYWPPLPERDLPEHMGIRQDYGGPFRHPTHWRPLPEGPALSTDIEHSPSGGDNTDNGGSYVER